MTDMASRKTPHKIEQNKVGLVGSQAVDGDDDRWAAIVSRDATADGTFYYSVATTGVYCRPSCAARLAQRENVAFHKTPADAERAGFRACKRCRPDRYEQAEREAAL